MRYALNTFAAFLLLTAFAAGSLDNARAQVRENKGYCSPDGRTVVFLIDVTTPYDETDKKVIVRMTDDIFSAIKGGDKFIIRTIGDSHTTSERLGERCMPYCNAKDIYGRLMGCSDGQIRTDTRVVREELVGSLKKRLASFQELPYSDIVRTIVDVANEHNNAGSKISLYIYSDLIENSDYFSSRYLFTYPLPRLIYGVQYYKLVAKLKDADVHVAGVGRAGTKDRRPLRISELNKLTEFWTAYFKESGAKEIVISPDVVAPSTSGQK